MNHEHFNLNPNDYMPDEEINRLYGDFHIDTDPDPPISSEQVFSTTGRILEERRCSLAHDAVEALTCLKDWQNARFRRQHQPDTEELMDDFSKMTIEESSGSNQPTS
ncbi:hypothetical protein Dsin_000366 [Dipteronia sinensis]|uniref:HAT C-terminal dimerisation domain-containing protein n=1 Tax=Dipteronia sinensis TaxID=43782 RepID=A0AAE0B3A9_9ROSI|nr:hypothetical protein Dsin_000366 [Dipteronia sinensis]